MTDASMIALVNMIGTFLTALLTGALTWFISRQKARDDRAAVLVAKVSETLVKADIRTSDALSKIKEDTRATLTHVNDQFLIQLRLYAESTKMVAALMPNDATRETAAMAERQYQEHKQSQEAAAKVAASRTEHTEIAREQLEVQKKIEENTSPPDL